MSPNLSIEIKGFYLQNIVKIVDNVFHENTSRLGVDLEAVAVLPKVFQIFTEFQNFDFFVVENLADRNVFGRVEGLAEGAGDEESLDLPHRQAPLKPEPRRDLEPIKTRPVLDRFHDSSKQIKTVLGFIS